MEEINISKEKYKKNTKKNGCNEGVDKADIQKGGAYYMLGK